MKHVRSERRFLRTTSSDKLVTGYSASRNHKYLWFWLNPSILPPVLERGGKLTTPVVVIRETQIKIPSLPECRSLESFLFLFHESTVVPDLFVSSGNISLEIRRNEISTLSRLSTSSCSDEQFLLAHWGNVIVEIFPIFAFRRKIK